jgi:hypothetical protein
VTAAKKAALWAQISALLVEHERAQTDAIRLALAKSWEDIRTALTVVAIDEAMAGDET